MRDSESAIRQIVRAVRLVRYLSVMPRSGRLPLPQWMRSACPLAGAAMSLHGPLIVLAILEAAGGILSTVLALAH